MLDDFLFHCFDSKSLYKETQLEKNQLWPMAIDGCGRLCRTEKDGGCLRIFEPTMQSCQVCCNERNGINNLWH